MSFPAGRVSFSRFRVVGDGSAVIHSPEATLERLEEHAIKPQELGVPDAIEYGWSGGASVLDHAFNFDRNVFDDCMHFAMQVVFNKVPGDVARAYKQSEEAALAAGNPSGFISKMQKQDAKVSVARKMEDDLRAGKFRRTKLIPILWNQAKGTLYAAVSGKMLECLMELFERTFGLTLSPLSSGTAALAVAENASIRRVYEDLRPTRFVTGGQGEGQWPEYPWVLKGPEPKNFIGNEFLLWLWWKGMTTDGTLKVSGKLFDTITFMFDRSLDLDCAFGQTGSDSLRGSGANQLPEAMQALKSGKVPRKATIIVDASGLQFTLTLNGETLAISSASLPDIEDAASSREVFLERIKMLDQLCDAIDAMFEVFISRRLAKWEQDVTAISAWIKRAGVNKAA